MTVVPAVVRSQRSARLQSAKCRIRGVGRKALLRHMSPSSKGRALSSMLQKLTRETAAHEQAGGAARKEKEWTAAAAAWRGELPKGGRKSSLGDAESSCVALRARWVTLRARWVTLRARWVTLKARWVTLRARWVTFRWWCTTVRCTRT